jgi:hypothetical protein
MLGSSSGHIEVLEGRKAMFSSGQIDLWDAKGHVTIRTPWVSGRKIFELLQPNRQI